jgi:hypothetical protein
MLLYPSHHQWANLEHTQQENEEAASRSQERRFLMSLCRTRHRSLGCPRVCFALSSQSIPFLTLSHLQAIPLQRAIPRTTPYLSFHPLLYVTVALVMFVLNEKNMENLKIVDFDGSSQV